MHSTSVFKASGVAALLLLAGCSSSTTKPEQYSGFLKDYSGLEKTTSSTGKPVMRWVAPGFNLNNYDSIVYNPVVYYPTPKPTAQISQKVLDGLLNYTNDKLKSAAASRKPLVTTPGPRSVIFRGAITAVDSSKEGCNSMKCCRLRWWWPEPKSRQAIVRWTPACFLKVS